MKKVEKKAKTFSLCAFYDYEVEYLCKYCYLNEDRDFVDREVKQSYQLDGGKLMNSIAELILNSECVCFSILENQIIIEHFDTHSGETADYDFKIKETGSHVFEEEKKERWIFNSNL